MTCSEVEAWHEDVEISLFSYDLVYVQTKLLACMVMMQTHTHICYPVHSAVCEAVGPHGDNANSYSPILLCLRLTS